MCSRWAGLSEEAVHAVQLTGAMFGPRPTLVATDDARRVLAGRLIAGADTARGASWIGLSALAARLTGDHAAARELSQRAAVSALVSGGAWGPAAVGLAMDRGHGALLVDFARRLALVCEDDVAACTWSLRTLIHTGNQALAVQLGRRSPHPQEPSWTAAVAPAAYSVGHGELAVHWLRACAEDPGFDTPSDELGAAVSSMAAILNRDEARDILGGLLQRWDEVAIAPEAELADALWRLVERADHPGLALGMAEMLHRGSSDVLDRETARREQARLVARDMGVAAGLLAVGLFERDRDVASGIDALSRTRSILDIERLRATLAEVVERLRVQRVDQLSEDQRNALIRSAASAAIGLDDGHRERLREQLADAGLVVEPELLAGIPEAPGASVREALAVACAHDFGELVASGSFGQARAIVLRGALVQRAGALPGRLAVDALLNAGAILEAHQLALRLLELYPGDQAAATAALVTAGWRARQDEAEALVLRTVAGRPALARQVPDALRQVAEIDPRAALTAASVARTDPAFRGVADELDELVERLRAEE